MNHKSRKKFHLYFTLLTTLLPLFIMCDNPETIVPLEPPVTQEKPDKLAQTDYIFDEDTIRTYEILITEESLDSIDDDPVAEQYVEGRFIIENDTIGPVGIRYKGNEGAWWNCVTNPPTGGSKTCVKLPMKIKINWKNDTTFYGLKKFQLHAMNTDPSQLREHIGYWFFRKMGIAAPRVVHVILKINGKFAGLFTHVEQIDGRFTRYNFKDGSGNLYKEVWPVDAYGKAKNTSELLAGLETNKDESPDPEMMETFGSELENSDDSTIKGVIEKWMNIDYTLSLAAVSYTIDDDDGLFHWYADGRGSSYPHNFYFYEEPKEKKLYLIPWDLDKILTDVADPELGNAIELIDDWGGISSNCELCGNGWPQRSAACDKLVAGLVKFSDEYKNCLAEIDTGAFSCIDEKITLWEEKLRPVTKMLYEQNMNFISPEEWDYAVSILIKELSDARAKLKAKLN